jgi:hypothetical protein
MHECDGALALVNCDAFVVCACSRPFWGKKEGGLWNTGGERYAGIFI